MNYKKLLKRISTQFILYIMFAANISVAQNGNSFTDIRDNKTYRTITLKDMVWMADNLNYGSQNSWCYNCENYGRLYSYTDATTACPEGWHLTTYEEWRKLNRMLETGVNDIKSKTGWPDCINCYDYWDFGAKPGGKYTAEGRLYMQGEYGFWWTSTPDGDNKAKSVYMGYDIDYIDFESVPKTEGMSIRCVKN